VAAKSKARVAAGATGNSQKHEYIGKRGERVRMQRLLIEPGSDAKTESEIIVLSPAAGYSCRLAKLPSYDHSEIGREISE